MAAKRVRFSDEIRRAVDASGLSRYAICKRLGIPEAQMSRFMAGKGFLGEGNLNALAELLGLHITAAKRTRTRKDADHG